MIEKYVGYIVAAILTVASAVGMVLLFIEVVGPWINEGLGNSFEKEYIHIKADCELGENVTRFTGYVESSFIEDGVRKRREYENVIVYSGEDTVLASVPSGKCFFQPFDSKINIFR